MKGRGSGKAVGYIPLLKAEASHSENEKKIRKGETLSTGKSSLTKPRR